MSEYVYCVGLQVMQLVRIGIHVSVVADHRVSPAPVMQTNQKTKSPPIMMYKVTKLARLTPMMAEPTGLLASTI